MQRISKLVIQIPGFNPGPKTLAGNNLYLIGNTNKRTLIDTGESDNMDCFNAIKSTIESENAEIDKILLTHWHPDHVGGLSKIKAELCPNAQVFKADLKRCENDFISALKSNENPKKFDLIQKYRPLFSEFGPGVNPLTFSIFDDVTDIQDEQVIKGEDFTLTSLYTPGHAIDHMCFHLHEENALFTGDNILGGSTTVVEDLFSYLNSLEKMKSINSSKLLTAHGHHETPDAIDRYITHRKKREDQIFEKLVETGIEMNPMDLVEKIYVPEGLKDNLKKPAAGNVLCTLIKLFVEDKIIQADQRRIYSSVK